MVTVEHAVHTCTRRLNCIAGNLYVAGLGIKPGAWYRLSGRRHIDPFDQVCGRCNIVCRWPDYRLDRQTHCGYAGRFTCYVRTSRPRNDLIHYTTRSIVAPADWDMKRWAVSGNFVPVHASCFLSFFLSTRSGIFSQVALARNNDETFSVENGRDF